MAQSGMSFTQFAIAFLATATIGCQSMGARQTVSTPTSASTVQTVKNESTEPERGPIVLLSRELQASTEQSNTESDKASLWSKLRTPTRFLLPRTDGGQGTVLETSQGFDDGF